jgi:hypothetical protein
VSGIHPFRIAPELRWRGNGPFYGVCIDCEKPEDHPNHTRSDDAQRSAILAQSPGAAIARNDALWPEQNEEED